MRDVLGPLSGTDGTALLHQSNLMHRIAEDGSDEAAMTDKGDDGITTLDPKAPDKNGLPRTYYLSHKAGRATG